MKNITNLALLVAVLAVSSWSQEPVLAFDTALVESQLSSPYEAERRMARESLIAALGQGLPRQKVLDLLKSPSGRVRLGAGQALVETAADIAELKQLSKLYEDVADKALRVDFLLHFFGRAFDLWDGEEPLAIGQVTQKRELDVVMLRFVAERLRELVQGGTLMSHHDVLARFVALEPLAKPALFRLLLENKIQPAPRSLAFSALARMDGANFWSTRAGGFSRGMQLALDNDSEFVEISALYGAAFAGVSGQPFFEAIARYAIDDAFGQEAIEGALYFLYSASCSELAQASATVAKTIVEFLDPLHSQRVRYNVGQLLAKIDVRPFLDCAFECVQQDPCFASYWIMAAVLSQAQGWSDKEWRAKAKPWCDWALRGDQKIPQLKALGSLVLVSKVQGSSGGE